MSVAAGQYGIRFIPPGTTFPYSGGVYATRDSVNSPILASSLGSDTTDQVVNGTQTSLDNMDPTLTTFDLQWQVQPVTGTTDTYKLTQPTDPNVHIGPVISGFSLDTSGTTDVILSTSILEWVLTAVDTTNNVYVISEPNHPIGTINDVTVSNGQLVIDTVAIGDNKDPIPQWQVIGINDLD